MNDQLFPSHWPLWSVPRNILYERAFASLLAASEYVFCTLFSVFVKMRPQPTSSAPAYLAVARGRIDVEGGLLKLGVSRDGVVAEIKVLEGEQVKKGQLLATLDSELAQLAVSAAPTEQRQVQTKPNSWQGSLSLPSSRPAVRPPPPRQAPATARVPMRPTRPPSACATRLKRPRQTLKSRRTFADCGTLRTGETQSACAGRR